MDTQYYSRGRKMMVKKKNNNLRGLAMLVPLSFAIAVVLELQLDKISDPGAYTSTQDPKLLKPDLLSLLVVDPTVMADGSEAGEYLHASVLSFPAETTMTTPALTALATA